MKDLDILFSVVIPTYNRSGTIMRAMKSVLNQTLQSFEIIIVDDGSTDSTKDVVFSLQDERVHYVYQSHRGAQEARNRGLNKARGEYLVFLDSDDELTPMFMEKMIKKHSISIDEKCVYGYVGMEGELKEISLLNDISLTGDIYSEILKTGFMKGPICITARRKTFLNVGGWDESFESCQDDDMCFRLAQKYQFDVIPEILVVAHKDYPEASNRISASIERVASGWWRLWQKYEKDVLKYCGERVIGKHYLSCAGLFFRVGDMDMKNKAIANALRFFDFERECKIYLDKIFSDRVYCYGAGEYGEIIGKYLISRRYKIEAFIVSDGNPKKDFVCGVPVLYLSEVCHDMKNTILLTTSEKFHKSIQANLSDYGFDKINTIPKEYYDWMWLAD